MLRQARHILEMIRFSHTLFALPFALLSAVLAWQIKGFNWIELLGIILCMVFARSTAMAFNRLADRQLDALNPRTEGRHLPRGVLSVGAVWIFTILCASAFVASTTLFLLAEPANAWPLVLSAPVLTFICAYSYTKRFTLLAHFWLGASLMLAPLAAWIAILQWNRVDIPLVLGLTVLFWVAGFDILYACQDVAFDRLARLRSIPAQLGVRAALRVAQACHIIMAALMGLLFWVAWPHLGWIYLGGAGTIALLLAYEHYLVSPEDLTRVNQAFFHVNAVVSVGLFLIVLVQVLVGP
jgi:4-hydroxybenzoate polyprenyltransferase